MRLLSVADVAISSRSSISESLSGAPDCWCRGDRIEQHEVMDGPVVADRRDPHARRCKLSPISFAFVAEHVILIDEKQCLRQTLELLGRGVDRRDVYVGTLG